MTSSPLCLLCLVALTVLSLLSAHAHASSFPHFQQRRAQSMDRPVPSMPVNPAKIPLFNRHMRSSDGLEVVKESDLDPNLRELSTEELYRMLELIELMESKKLDKVSPHEMETLNYLMHAYTQ